MTGILKVFFSLRCRGKREGVEATGAQRWEMSLSARSPPSFLPSFLACYKIALTINSCKINFSTWQNFIHLDRFPKTKTFILRCSILCEANRLIGKAIFIENDKCTHVTSQKRRVGLSASSQNSALRKASPRKSGKRTHDALRLQWPVNEVVKTAADFGLFRTLSVDMIHKRKLKFSTGVLKTLQIYLEQLVLFESVETHISSVKRIEYNSYATNLRCHRISNLLGVVFSDSRNPTDECSIMFIHMQYC